MKNSVGMAVVAGIVIIVGVIAFQLYETSYKVTSPEEYKESIGTGSVAHVVYQDNPQFLGPLQINKDKYLLGENIYVVLKDLMPGDKGAVLFYTPGGVLYEEWEFDGDERDFQKKYFKPQLLKGKNLCEKEDLVGTWTVMFRSYEGMTLEFEMLNKILPNQEYQFEGCAVAYEIDIINP